MISDSVDLNRFYADGRHSLAFNFNGDWSGDSDAVIEGEFCGK